MLKLVALVVLLTGAISSYAQTTNYTATLDPAQDGGGLRSGSGTAALALNGTTLSWHVEFTGLSAPSTAAHIHGPAAPGVNAGVLYGFTGTFNTTAGSFDGSATLTDQRISELNSGLFYVNIHSTAFTGGEIRGQISQVPEPSTYALLGASALGALALRKRRA